MISSLLLPPGGTAPFAEGALCLALGTGLTFGLFFAIAHIEGAAPAVAAPGIEDARLVSALYDPPPPKVEEHPAEPASVPLTGVDVGASDSPVKLAVVPPDLDMIIPPDALPPKATIQFSPLVTGLQPKAGPLNDLDHIFQQNEVDEVPKAVVQTIARITSGTRDDADQLRATFVLVIDTNGSVANIRVLSPSGNAKFDAIVMECLRDEWVFSPAIKKGRRVRCMVQQLVWYEWTGGSIFRL